VNNFSKFLERSSARDTVKSFDTTVEMALKEAV
jgi:hypothetical protein